MQIAGFQPGELRQIIRLNIFDAVASLLQHLAHDLGRDQLPGPVVQCQLDRIGRILGERRPRRGQNGQTRHSKRSDKG